ncbi:hypothetical protein GUJ93_ZPchr0008g12291 [Zizania palustris]|uniref:Uncharacterized protein n=1 Tax=Zizania palustris TaxID=103762 RepID=A0A8J5UXC9_ZIZPA|nr:hypothetical protein GUJ93_ZPchr0008g12291 [Zizania palustris]
MISSKKLAQLSKKWQGMVAGKGNCVVYSCDGRRFEIPLAYLRTTVFAELLRMSQEEFGFTSRHGRITLPCDTAVMEYVMCLLRRDASEEVEKALLSSMVMLMHPLNQQAICS